MGVVKHYKFGEGYLTWTSKRSAGANFSIIGGRSGHHGQVVSSSGLKYRDKQPSTLTFTPTGDLESPINLLTPSLHVFGLWEEAGEPQHS